MRQLDCAPTLFYELALLLLFYQLFSITWKFVGLTQVLKVGLVWKRLYIIVISTSSFWKSSNSPNICGIEMKIQKIPSMEKIIDSIKLNWYWLCNLWLLFWEIEHMGI